MSDDAAFHAPVPHVHDRATDLADDAPADETPPGGFRAADERQRDADRGDDDGVIPVPAPLSPDL
jgi:hypothetical protein